ncbi:MAG: hypothetical protein JO162_06000 [Alphaproteobacteria bacterium]|nr:hypothetical protein [Alphaproteobacteria bacterium]MBV9015036.1 hypothetical protein [Alphaproteobacteria bacterium]MBV9153796.1 hypothetical protein [Alphaproteobacteria bacterium]MBV9585433.1 hypothetical protein [Alphaproteobacteria bacterium]MBV9965912.1 hypothetical protein [Alphaproteobacteria bacterium]
MSLPRKYLKVVSQLITPGALGAVLTLGAAAPAAASTDAQASLVQREPVAERLTAIREAVSEIAGAEAKVVDPTASRRLAWLNWRNGGWGGGWGWGRPWGGPRWGWGGPWNNWHNWNNWRNFWNNF